MEIANSRNLRQSRRRSSRKVSSKIVLPLEISRDRYVDQHVNVQRFNLKRRNDSDFFFLLLFFLFFLSLFFFFFFFTNLSDDHHRRVLHASLAHAKTEELKIVERGFKLKADDA